MELLNCAAVKLYKVCTVEVSCAIVVSSDGKERIVLKKWVSLLNKTLPAPSFSGSAASPLDYAGGSLFPSVFFFSLSFLLVFFSLSSIY